MLLTFAYKISHLIPSRIYIYILSPFHDSQPKGSISIVNAILLIFTDESHFRWEPWNIDNSIDCLRAPQPPHLTLQFLCFSAKPPHLQSLDFRLVNFAARSNLSYIPFASSTIRQIGCGRAIYTGRSGQSTSSSTDMPIAGRTMAVGFGDRVEALVCNYGPLDRNTARELYEDGVPALCPSGTIRSSRYRALCRKCFLVEMFPPRNSRDRCRFLSLLSVLSLAVSAYSAC